METEITLLGTFFISLIVLRIRYKEYKFALSGRIAMSAMLVLTAMGHFLFTKGMAMMLSDFIPFKIGIVYFTGILELAVAVGLLIPKIRVITAWLLIVFFVLLLPANIYAAMHHVNLQTATLDGKGPDYLWFRVPLQLAFIGWVYLSAIRPSKQAK
jgi:uncharacterized membrane protein